jgi:UDP-N-acetylmuramyl pentapeptide phosphotransferase/UDP-N-acetylglucosamine-1-phosphate transferase
MTGATDAWAALGVVAPAVWLAALGGALVLIVALRPVLANFAVATANTRSSHKAPTPQWGGLPVMGATLGVVAVALLAPHALGAESAHSGVLLLAAALLLVALGTADDTLDLGAGAKIVVQSAAVILMLAALPDDARVLPFLPQLLERALLLVGALWFVNLVNFMDGIDWMLVAEMVPVTAGVALIGALGALPPEALVVALALNGAMLGFAPFNRPVARLFMGDMGSLPIGLLVAWLLIVVAGEGHYAAAVLLPLYYIADTGITLLRRMRAGEPVWQAHRTHFYQRAGDGGFTTLDIVGRVFAVNVALAALAAMSVIAPSPLSCVLALIAGIGLVAWLMTEFARGKR